MIDFIMLTYVFTYNNTPICSMYGIFTYIWVIFRANVGKYSSTMEHMGLRIAQNYCHRIGWWENLQENPIFDGKNHGFRLRFSLKPTQWYWSLALKVALKVGHLAWSVPQEPIPPRSAFDLTAWRGGFNNAGCKRSFCFQTFYKL